MGQGFLFGIYIIMGYMGDCYGDTTLLGEVSSPMFSAVNKSILVVKGANELVEWTQKFSGVASSEGTCFSGRIPLVPSLELYFGPH